MHKILKTLTVRLLAGAVLIVSSAALNAATTLSLEPGSSHVGVGSSFVLNLVASGLGEHAPPSLSLFDVDVSYDVSLFSLGGVTFGSDLGDASLSEAIVGSDTATPGSVNLWEFSQLGSNSLEVLQTSTLTLASVSFTAIQPGTGSFGLAVNSFGDGFGDPLTVGLAASSSVSAVPVPAAVWLFGAALAGLGVFGYRREKPTR